VYAGGATTGFATKPPSAISFLDFRW
jgi:hypothetical protein